MLNASISWRKAAPAVRRWLRSVLSYRVKRLTNQTQADQTIIYYCRCGSLTRCHTKPLVGHPMCTRRWLRALSKHDYELWVESPSNHSQTDHHKIIGLCQLAICWLLCIWGTQCARRAHYCVRHKEKNQPIPFEVIETRGNSSTLSLANLVSFRGLTNPLLFMGEFALRIRYIRYSVLD